MHNVIGYAIRGISAIYTGWPEPIPGKDLLATVFLLLLWSICRLHLLFLRLQTFWFRNNRIHGISISKGMIIYSENGILMAEVTWELLRLPTRSQETVAGSRVGFLAKRTHIPYSVHSVHSAIGSRMNGMIFNTFRKRNRSQKNTNTIYSEYSYSGIVPKERALRVLFLVFPIFTAFSRYLTNMNFTLKVYSMRMSLRYQSLGISVFSLDRKKQYIMQSSQMQRTYLLQKREQCLPLTYSNDTEV